MGTLRVTGKGQLKIRPDTTCIKISLKGMEEEYSEILHRSAMDTAKLKDLLSAYGFERSDLKTLYFDVDTEYQRHKEGDEYKSRFVGYTYEHDLKIEFDSDHERLGKILYGLAHCSLQPEFRISYTIKDQEAAKNELLGKAVKDAKEKALILSKSAGVSLKEIESIDYSWGEVKFETRLFEQSKILSKATLNNSYDIDIEPDDMDVSDTVTVVWKIA